MGNLAQLLLLRGTLAEAEPLAQEAFATSSRLLGPDHEHTALLEHIVRAVSTRRAAEQRQQAAEVSMLLLASWPPPGKAWSVGD